MEVSVGSVLGRSWGAATKNFGPFVVIALILAVPQVIVALALPVGSDPLEPNRVNQLANNIVNSLTQQLLAAAIVFGAVEHLRGRKVEIGRCLSVGLNRMFPVLGVAILMGLGVALGLALLIVPGLILMCVWYVAIPAAVIERPGVFGAFSRSSELTRGHRWTIFGIYLVFFLVGMGVGVFLVGSMMATQSAIVTVIVTVVIGMLVSIWAGAAQAVAYHDLRVKKEGIGTDEIAAVFE